MSTTGNMSTMKTMEEFVSIVQPLSSYIYTHILQKTVYECNLSVLKLMLKKHAF